MDPSLLKRDHHPYKRGERRRKPFTTPKGAPPPQQDMVGHSLLLREPTAPTRGLILVVEPEVSLRRDIGSALVNQGYSVAEAATLAQAIALLRQVAFDIVLLDLEAPDGVDRVLLQSLSDATALTTPLILLPARPPPVEQGSPVPPGMALPQSAWLEALLHAVERVCQAPGSPERPAGPSEAMACEG